MSSATATSTQSDTAAIQAQLKAAAAKRAKLAKLKKHHAPAKVEAAGAEKNQPAAETAQVATAQQSADALRTLGSRESTVLTANTATPAVNAQAAQTAYQGASKVG